MTPDGTDDQVQPDVETRFRSLFDQHWGAVVAYARRRTNDLADAHDVAADTFAVAWRRVDDLPRLDDEVLPWLFGIARRVAANLHRGVRRQRALGQRIGGDPTERVASDPPSVGASEEVQRVREAIDALGDIDREILQLAVWEELPHATIADLLDLSVSAVSVRLHRARQRLRDLLAGGDA